MGPKLALAMDEDSPRVLLSSKDMMLINDGALAECNYESLWKKRVISYYIFKSLSFFDAENPLTSRLPTNSIRFFYAAS
jgi:hypothetical protein